MKGAVNCISNTRACAHRCTRMRSQMHTHALTDAHAKQNKVDEVKDPSNYHNGPQRTTTDHNGPQRPG